MDPSPLHKEGCGRSLGPHGMGGTTRGGAEPVTPLRLFELLHVQQRSPGDPEASAWAQQGTA